MSEAFFFGDSRSKLFGIYEPAMKAVEEKAVLICYPIGHEYLRTYRCFKKIANKLTRAGAHVMRFDYTGTGDSYCHSDESSLVGWLQDINLAIEELKAISGVSKVTLIGLRLGATMAAMVGKTRQDVDTIICWDPVINGETYLDRLRKGHGFMLKDLDRFVKAREPEVCDGNEFLGYHYSEELIQEISNIGFSALNYNDGVRFSLICSSDNASAQQSEFNKRLSEDVRIAKYFDHQMVWSDFTDLETTFLPHDIVDFIVDEATQ